MNISGKFKMGSKLAALTAAGMLAVTANPAGALGESGAGAGSGEFTTFSTNDRDITSPPLCLEVTAAVLELHNTGTYTATSLSGRSTYVGRSHAVITAQADYYFNPAGTFADNQCIVPATVPVSIVVNEEGTNPGDVFCTGSGTYNRTVENAEVVGTGSCDVTEGTTLRQTTAPTVLTFEGLQQPCFPEGPPPVDPCQSEDTDGNGTDDVFTEWVGTYSET